MKIGLIIMASGLGKRFGGDKLMVLFKDKPLIKWIMDTTVNLFDQRIVVTRNRQVEALCTDVQLPCIYHELPYRSDTVRFGVTALDDDTDYCFFVPGDQPLLKRASIAGLIESAKKHPDRIIRAGYGENLGSPIGFPKRFFEELKDLPDGKGGSWIANKYSELVQVISVEDPFELMDIDTRDDFELLMRRSNPREKSYDK